MIPQEFEKDDDTNGHIDYIVATAVSSIIAAWNYSLEPYVGGTVTVWLYCRWNSR